MKKLNILLLCGTLMLSGMALTSCDSELSALPTQSKVDGNLVVDAKSAEHALNGVYYEYAMCTTDNYDILSTGCSMFYEVLPSDIAGTIVYYQGPYYMETHGSTYYSYYLNASFWTSFYSTITAANAVIGEMAGADDSWFAGNRKTEIIAEARCMRAISNYQLLRFFGYYWDTTSPYGNVLKTAKSTSQNLSSPRSNVADTYAAIIEDLDFAIENGPDAGDNANVNKWVAKGMKARVLMLRGTGSDYADAGTLCKDIIDNGPYTLENHTDDIFHKKGLSSNEVMFGIAPKDNQTEVYEQYYYRGSAQYNATDNFLAMFNGDPRKDEQFVIETASIPSYKIYYDENGNMTGYELIYVTKETSTICKHLNPNDMSSAGTVEESQYQMRLSEIYLLYAESLARQGKIDEAKAQLKIVEEHVGITDFTDLEAANDYHSFMKLYMNEYLKNLFCESGREIDLLGRMYNDAQTRDLVLEFNPEYESGLEMTVLAIPEDEMNNNSSLSSSNQNPGYSSGLAE